MLYVTNFNVLEFSDIASNEKKQSDNKYFSALPNCFFSIFLKMEKNELNKSLEHPAGKVIIVGIAGPTRSGKSSLAEALAHHFNCDTRDIVHQDKSWKVFRHFNYRICNLATK